VPDAPEARSTTPQGPDVDATGPDTKTAAPAFPEDYVVGQEIEVTVDKVAHGGHFVARHNDLVVFVRHALPGEDVTARVTEISAHYLRADAIRIHSAHPSRVTPNCPAFHPGGCGGCDFAHANQDLQRDLKLQVLRESLHRQGKLSIDRVEELTRMGIRDLGNHEGWRTRMRYRTMRRDSDVVLALRAHRSDQLVDASSCVIADPTGHAYAREFAHSSPEGGDVLMAVDSGGPVVEFIAQNSRDRARRQVRHTIEVDDQEWEFRTRIDGFWQVHPRLAQTLVQTVLAWADPKPGEKWWDLYAGVGPIAAALATRVGGSGHVVAVEGSSFAVREAQRNLGRRFVGDELSVVRADVRRWIANDALSEPDPDGVVMDPPRSGAGRPVLQGVAARQPRRLIVVACDPVALGRDTAILAEFGYRLERVTAWDAFPHTHHLETVALFLPADQIS
jgi:tRNA/tmRNA/rRNA uracil-C5-methylase (TrmA/RlmC/RlmD family)